MICSLCGRKLKKTKSINLGYGPVCYKKMLGISQQGRYVGSASHMADIPYYDIPGQMSLDDYIQIEN